MKALGLRKTRGIQRTDRLALVSRARARGRRELVVATMRCTLRVLVKEDADWLRATMPAEWVARDRTHGRDERQRDEERAALTVGSGDDG